MSEDDAPNDTSECIAPRLLTYSQTAVELGVSRSTLDRWRKTRPGFPQPFHLAKRTGLWFDEAEVLAWLLGTVARQGFANDEESTDEDEG